MDNDEIEFIEEGHIYLKSGIIIPSVSEILKKIFPNKYSNVPIRILQNKSKYGTKVHELIEKYENKEEYIIDNSYIEISFNEYKELKKKNKIEVLSQEEIVHYKNYYAGRYDMVALVNGKASLIDIKTTSELDKKYLSWQLSMYELAIGKEFDKLYCLWLPKGGIGKLVEIERIEKKEIEKMLGE